LFPKIGPIMASTFDHTRAVMRIISQYILLGNSSFLELYVKNVVEIFESIIGNLKELPTIWTLEPINIFFQLFPTEAFTYLQNLLQKILILLLTSQESDLVKVHYISIFARCLLGNKEAFFSFFQNVSQTSNNPNLFFNFLDLWIDKVDNIPTMQERKLTALALCNIFPTADIQILKYVGIVISICVGIMQEKKAANSDDLHENDDTEIPVYSAAQEQLMKSDPVLLANLHGFLIQKLKETASLNREIFEQIMQSSVDPLILNQLQNFNLQ